MDKRPMLFVNEDLAEGIYASSGSPVSDGIKVDSLGKENGAFKFRATLPNGLSYPVKTVFTFDAGFNTFWASGVDNEWNNSKAVFIVKNPITSFEFFVMTSSETINIVSSDMQDI